MMTFHSTVGPSIMMFDTIAFAMLEAMGKEQTPQGVITVAQLPNAIARLQALISRHRNETQQASDEPDSAPPISLATRAIPLLELLQLAAKSGKAVTWGI